MNPYEEGSFWAEYQNIRRTTDQRKGQALMNALRQVAPELYEMITGTNADPFYRDDVIREFLATLGIPLWRAMVKP